MSILSQIGVIILIIGTIFVLIRANRQLEDAAREGEHFVDEWALRESLKEEQKKQIAAAKEPVPRAFRAKRPKFVGESETGQALKSNKSPGNLAGVQADPREKVIIKEVNFFLVEPADFQNPERMIPVRKLPFTIGRAPNNDFVVDDLCVARYHCRIIWKDQHAVIEDIGTRNGIYINGNPQTRAVLKDNLRIGIGNKEFVVLEGEQTWRRQSVGK